MNDSLELFRSAPESQTLDGLGSGDVINGRRWYVFSKDLPEKGQVTFLLNSDRSFLHVERIEDGRVSVLSDSTKIRDLCVTEFRSWSYSSMEAFLDGRASVRSWQELLESIKVTIKKLIYADDDTILLLSVFTIATYVAQQFHAMPFLHLIAPAGSGKSWTSSVILRLAANGSNTDNSGQIASFGKGSQAALFRSIALRCTCCLDDLEIVQSEKPSQLRQGLLVSYKRSTATQVLTERGRPKPYNLFGAKLISSIGQCEPVLRTRVLELRMSQAPLGFVPASVPDHEFRKIRDDLHVACMSNEKIKAIDEAVQRAEADPQWGGGRFGEITTGLRAIGELAGVGAELARILQSKRPVESKPAMDLRSTVISLFKEGYQAISTLQVWTRLAASGNPTSLTGLGMELSKLGLLRADGHVVIHGTKSRLLYPNKKLRALIATKPNKRPRSWCRQSHRKTLDEYACAASGCPWREICPILAKLKESSH